MQSPAAAHETIDVTGINAPVNYAAALKRYYPLLARLAYPVGKVDQSVCIGTCRLTFKIDYMDEGPVVYYRPHKTIIENRRGDEHRRIYMFVTPPIIMLFPYPCPMKTVVDLESEVINSILLPLGDDQKIDFMWRIGNALTDLIKNPCVIVLYGPTGKEGKTVLSMNISRILGTGVEWTVTDLIGKASKWPESDTVIELAQKRIIMCDECAIDEDMNYNNIKRWTSNAPVQCKGISSYLPQTIIGITNKIGFCSKGAINNSIGRTLVMYKMDKKLGKMKPFEENKIDSFAKI